MEENFIAQNHSARRLRRNWGSNKSIHPKGRTVAATIGALLLLEQSLSTLFAATLRLDIRRAEGAVIELSWPAELAGVELQETSSLLPQAEWRPVTNAPALDGTLLRLRLNALDATRFFRLGRLYPGILETSPRDGASGVAVLRETFFRLTEPLSDSAVIGTDRLHAEFGGRRLLGRIDFSHDRQTVTLFHQEPLPGSARVRVTFNGDGLRDELGQPFDFDNDGRPGGTSVVTFDTVDLTPVAKTAVCGFRCN